MEEEVFIIHVYIYIYGIHCFSIIGYHSVIRTDQKHQFATCIHVHVHIPITCFQSQLVNWLILIIIK